MPVPVHSAHVGQVYRVHYRWHAYFDADVKVFRTFNRGDGQHVNLERDPGIAIVAPAWILSSSNPKGNCPTLCGTLLETGNDSYRVTAPLLPQ